MARDLGYVQTPSFGKELSGIASLLDENRAKKKEQKGNEIMEEVIRSGDPEKMKQFVKDYPEHAERAENIMGFQDTLNKQTMRSVWEGATTALSKKGLSAKIRYLEDRRNRLLKEGKSARHTTEALEIAIDESIPPEEREKLLDETLNNAVRLAEGMGATGIKGGREFAKKSQLIPRKNPETGQYEYGWATFDPNTDEQDFLPIEGDFESPEDRLQRELKYKRMFEEIKTEEDFQRKLNAEKTPMGQFQLAKLKFEDEKRKQGVGAGKQRAENAINAMDRLITKDLDMIYGAADMMIPETGVLAGLMRSGEGLQMLVDRDKLINVLILMSRKELEGQGQITEGEQAMLAKAATALGDNRMQPDMAYKEMEAIRPVFERAVRGIDSPDMGAAKGMERKQYPVGKVMQKNGVSYEKQADGRWKKL